MIGKIQGLFKTLLWKSRTFQGFLAIKDFSRTYYKIQGLFKTVRTLFNNYQQAIRGEEAWDCEAVDHKAM